jgi:hypothetical protein
LTLWVTTINFRIPVGTLTFRRMSMHLTLWCLAVIGVLIALLPTLSCKAHSAVWRALGWLGFDVTETDLVRWPGAKARRVLWTIMLVGLGGGLAYGALVWLR